MKKTILYVIRHGETEWNKIGRQQGHLNSDLTKNGTNQAKAIADYLDNDFDVIITSDLGRAVQTAGIIAEKLKIDIIYNSKLRERNLGIMQGLTMKEFEKSYPEEYKQFKSGDPDYIIPKGESARQRFNRVIEAFKAIVLEYSGKKILIVAHGGILDSLFRFITSLPLNIERPFPLINGSINILSYNGSWRIEVWGYLDHLQKLKALDDF